MDRERTIEEEEEQDELELFLELYPDMVGFHRGCKAAAKRVASLFNTNIEWSYKLHGITGRSVEIQLFNRYIIIPIDGISIINDVEKYGREIFYSMLVGCIRGG